MAEYQKRDAVHFHAVIRLDGPEGGETPPPAWATADLLTDAIRAAAAAARVDGPEVDGRPHTAVLRSRAPVIGISPVLLQEQRALVGAEVHALEVVQA